jgi:hypothetical protein
MAERESSLAERERKDKEKADAIMERRIRLGHIEAPPKAKSKKSTAKEEEKSKETE